MDKLNGTRVAILATNGFENSELFEPKHQLEAAGARVWVVAPNSDPITSWDDGNWGGKMSVDVTLEQASIADFDALVLPGGQINPDVLRADETAVRWVREFFMTGKPVAAICHAPWLLIEANVINGRNVTCYKSIATDVKNAGGCYLDSAVVVDNGLITSRCPDDLDAFCAKLIEEISEGRHQRLAS